MKHKKEILLGLFFITALLLLGWGIEYLNGKNIFRKSTYYHAVYNRIEGLLEANPVTVNGFTVGQVTDIAFAEDGVGKILVTFELKEELALPKNSIARIYSSDIMGSKAIALVLGDAKELAQAGDTLNTEVEGGIKEAVNKQVEPIKRKAENLLASLDTMVTVIQGVLNENTRRKLNRSFTNIEKSLDYLKNTTYNLDTLVTSEKDRLAMIVANLESITRNIDSKEDKVNNIINNLSSLSDTLASTDISTTLANTNQTLKDLSQIFNKLNGGAGTAGQLLNNDTLYRNLEAATAELNMLLLDMKLNPRRYVHFSVFGRGKKKNEYQPPTEEEMHQAAQKHQ
jgi:phospholipid/cholesterol/gamma-HCH transport system substrate-binding protein